ncbi:head GIN domain-containing protein [Sphingomonas sp. LaA6.9]|uniref:head GIN domain-containing protein n=1 Tax=Sphingomonas sp. LaA6.9 TaxID=2919914 RepID=UPI001F4FED1E|nr:head GIN domain-containing protein [Sphingomonas sp. LaA6.9]MCJ8158603.1 DUF2807 domain-containing protein [Sphingomonas sp. LaA6.9]
MRMLFLLPPLLLATACSAEADNGTPLSGVKGSRAFAATGFDSVSLRGPDNVVVKVGGAESVTAAGDQAILDRLEIEVVDGTLRVDRKKKYGMSWGGEKGAATVTVTLPMLKGASVAGSGDMDVDRVESPKFDASVAGSGSLNIGSLAASALDLSIAGSGNANIAGGKTEAVDVSIAGSGNFDAPGLTARTADISIAGSGGVKANVSETADVSIIGSGDVELYGNPKCNVSKIGSGDARCMPVQSASTKE